MTVFFSESNIVDVECLNCSHKFDFFKNVISFDNSLDYSKESFDSIGKYLS
jgi:hypothetical protein